MPAGAASTWAPVATICGVQRWLTGSRIDFDTGEACLDLDQQRWVGAVEAVDRLSGVADEEQIVATGPEQVDDAVLHAG